MPSVPKTGPSFFLGIELGIDQLRASIVDESLELVGVECVDFDSELSEYKCVCGVSRRHLCTDPIRCWSLERRVGFSRPQEKHTRPR